MCDCMEKLKKSIQEMKSASEVEIDEIDTKGMSVNFIPTLKIKYKTNKYKKSCSFICIYCPICGKKYKEE